MLCCWSDCTTPCWLHRDKVNPGFVHGVWHWINNIPLKWSFLLERRETTTYKGEKSLTPHSFPLDSRSTWNGSNCWNWEPKLPQASVRHRAVGKCVHWEEEKPTCYIPVREKSQLAPCGLRHIQSFLQQELLIVPLGSRHLSSFF